MLNEVINYDISEMKVNSIIIKIIIHVIQTIWHLFDLIKAIIYLIQAN
jgi:hypothetical protein